MVIRRYTDVRYGFIGYLGATKLWWRYSIILFYICRLVGSPLDILVTSEYIDGEVGW